MIIAVPNNQLWQGAAGTSRIARDLSCTGQATPITVATYLL